MVPWKHRVHETVSLLSLQQVATLEVSCDYFHIEYQTTIPETRLCRCPLVQTTRWRHGGFDRQAAHVLPALLEQRDQIIDGQHDVANELILGHANIAHRDSHAQHLLQLEFDGRLDLGHLGV